MKRLVGYLAGVLATVAALLATVAQGHAGTSTGTTPPAPGTTSTPSPTPLPVPQKPATIVITPNGTICWEIMKPDCPCETTVTLSAPANGPVSFLVSTVDGTATARTRDYVPIDPIRVTIPAGATSARIPFRILPDGEREPDEYFFIVISSVSGAQVGRDRAQVIIKDGLQP